MILDNLKPRAIICDEKTIEIAKEFRFDGKLYLYDELIQAQIEDGLLAGIRAKISMSDTVPLSRHQNKAVSGFQRPYFLCAD